MSLRPIRRALLSAHDKTGLRELAEALAARDVELISTGGTAKALRDAGLAVSDISEVTGTPEILGGRVKTLHPAIHAGILARRDVAQHTATLDEHGITPIDLVVVNLYPFEQARRRGDDYDSCVEEIDIGGVALLRAAAKNHAAVAVVVEPADYQAVLAELAAKGGTDAAFRRELARKAFARTAAYDAAIALWLADETGTPFPERLVVPATRDQLLRYGENPQQRAALYVTDPTVPGVGIASLAQGKPLSFNNLADADAALAIVSALEDPAVAIIKHLNPCGVAEGTDVLDAYRRAVAADPVSAFGGVVACNRPLDEAAARAITALFTEVVVAPEADAEALAVFKAKPALRVLLTGELPDAWRSGLDLRPIAGGLLVQDRDIIALTPSNLVTVTRRAPSAAELADLLFGWSVVRHVKSNAIVLARDRATVGIGMGQTSRVEAVELAVGRATKHAGSRPCVLASDGFFPFADGLEAAIAAGATACIQPGGSKNDATVAAAADAAGVAMVVTGVRHFRH